MASREDAGTVPTTNSVAPDAPFARLGANRSNANNLGTYVEAEKTIAGFDITTGMRLDRLPGETNGTVDPRVAVSRQVGNWTTRLAGGLFHQGRWRGDQAIPDAGTPLGLPLVARHLVAGVEHKGESSVLKAEAFLKWYDDYRKYGAGPAIKNARGRGVEITAQRSVGKLNGWASYSLLDAGSRLASGDWVPSAFDITHSATGSVTATIARDWSIGTTARSGTGAPYTPILGGRAGQTGRIEPVYGALMSERLPAYARLDGRLMRYVRTRSFLLTTFAELLNATGRRNVGSFAYDASYTHRETMRSFFSQRTLVIGGELMLK